MFCEDRVRRVQVGYCRDGHGLTMVKEGDGRVHSETNGGVGVTVVIGEIGR